MPFLIPVFAVSSVAGLLPLGDCVPETGNDKRISQVLKLGICGIGGRMGNAVWDCCQGLDGVKVVCGIDRLSDSLPTGFAAELEADPEALHEIPNIFIDFSRPECSLKLMEFCVQHKCGLVLGTTGFSTEQRELIKKASKSIPIVFAANFSVGVTVLCNLIRKASAVLSDTDLEIIEAHHRYKVDAPSGTALAMGEAAAEARHVNLKDVMVEGRNSQSGARQYGTIGFSSVRGGDIVGEHTAMFCADGERLELKHVATSRQTFASGALRSARWLEDKKPGLYNLNDVLGLN